MDFNHFSTPNLSQTYLWKQVPEKRKAERSTRISRESLQEVPQTINLRRSLTICRWQESRSARGVTTAGKKLYAMDFRVLSLFGDCSFDWGHLGLFSTEVDDRAFDVFCSWQRRKSEAEREWAVCRSSDLSDCDRPNRRIRLIDERAASVHRSESGRLVFT